MTLTSIGDLPVRKVSEQHLKFNFLVYGQSGAGKTRLAGSAFEVPELCPLIYLNCEGGELTLKTTYPEIESVRITSWDQLQKVHDTLKKKPNHGYKTVILDSVTEMQKMGMDHTMLTRHGENDMAVPEIKEWNINIEQTRKYIRAFRDLPNVNVIYTALERIDIDKRSGMSRKKPSLSGKVADEIAGFLDIVTYLYVEEIDKVNTRILLTSTVPGTVAKDRSDSLPLQIANPKMKDIYGYISGKIDQVKSASSIDTVVTPKEWETANAKA